MSRIGKQLMAIPSGVTVEAKDGMILVSGPKGVLKRPLDARVSVIVENGTVRADVADKEEKSERSVWGTFAAHIKNMMTGVTTGFQKQLEINGVGYRVAMQGKDLKFEVGYSHPVVYQMPADVSAAVEKNLITLKSSDKELLGRTAAEIRDIRKPEPYKGKGIKYLDEVIRRKAGKTAAKTSA
jgi:large subunit ribosomal protein L6